jgi:hypothetical protein
MNSQNNCALCETIANALESTCVIERLWLSFHQVYPWGNIARAGGYSDEISETATEMDASRLPLFRHRFARFLSASNDDSAIINCS